MASVHGMVDYEGRLHKLSRDGRLRKIEEVVAAIDPKELFPCLNMRRGPFGYTVLHEAVSGNSFKVISYLIQQGANVNQYSVTEITPLHLAASHGHMECVKVLMENNADISLKDGYGRTPAQTASLCSRSNILRLLRSEEIIKEVKINGDNLTKLLRSVKVEDLEPQCLEKALVAAVEVGNHINVSKLVIKGATNIEEVLVMSKELKKHEARAMLLLVIAAQGNDRDLILKLFDAPTHKTVQHSLTCDDEFCEVQRAVISGRVSTVVPIEMARRCQNPIVHEELLLRTDVNQEEGSVYWHGLHLLVLDLSWIRKIHWVKRLRLARNGFTSIPNEIGGYLKQVVKLDLQHNELATIPHCLLELPSLNELDLSNNKLIDIPDVHEWSPGLTVLNLSYNELSNLPLDVTATSITSLNLSFNRFGTVPHCVCSFKSLQHLDISYNTDIVSLPVEMGHLLHLSKLLTDGLTNLSDPPREIQRNTHECIRYLNDKLMKQEEMKFQEDNDSRLDEGKIDKSVPSEKYLICTEEKARCSDDKVLQNSRNSCLITLDIDSQGVCQGESLHISCTKPVVLDQVMNTVATEGNLQNIKGFYLAYRQGDLVINLTSQDKLDQYMKMENKPNLLLVQKT